MQAAAATPGMTLFLFPHFAVLSEGVFRFSGVSPEPEVSILVGVALSSFTIGAVHTVGRSADPTHLTQRQVICPALMLSGQQNKGIRILYMLQNK